MKKNIIILLSFIIVAFLACNEGIDPINQVDPGPDQESPQVNITFPLEGTTLKVLEEITSIDIKFEVTDDIEIAKIDLLFDGNEIATFSEFLDYRRFLGEYTYDNVGDGMHTLTVTATDLDGKTGSASVNFEKEPPYVPVYDNEVLYMPFDGDFIDLISITRPEVNGSPSFAGESFVGQNAYQGSEDAYLTFPTEGLLGDEFTAVFWMKVTDSPNRAGILVIGPPDEANPDAQNNRTNGFRFFREAAGNNQRFKLNIGRGDGDSWFDGGENADVAPNTGVWTHFAFTISPTKAAVYINGQVAREGDFAGVDWTGCDVLSIMSGAPRFTGWNHRSDQGIMDELRIFDVALTQEEIQQIIFDESGQSGGYTPQYDGEMFYMSFDGEVTEMVSGQEPTVTGMPDFAEGIKGQSYAGAADSYLTFPTEGMLGEEFSATFWMNVNDDPDRAGILVIGPPDEANPDAQNNRTNGFRFFREAAGEEQRFKLNIGRGEGDSWFDGGEDADVMPNTGEWNHFAFTISGTQAAVYINGQIAREGDFSGIGWDGCDILTIMSGEPRFTQWGHGSDLSLLDELRLYNKALTQEEVMTIMNADR